MSDTHKRTLRLYALRYKPGTDLARRFPGIASGRFTQKEAERVRLACPNAEHIEVVEASVESYVHAVPGDRTCERCGGSFKVKGWGIHRKYCGTAA